MEPGLIPVFAPLSPSRLWHGWHRRCPVRGADSGPGLGGAAEIAPGGVKGSGARRSFWVLREAVPCRVPRERGTGGHLPPGRGGQGDPRHRGNRGRGTPGIPGARDKGTHATTGTGDEGTLVTLGTGDRGIPATPGAGDRGTAATR